MDLTQHFLRFFLLPCYSPPTSSVKTGLVIFADTHAHVYVPKTHERGMSSLAEVIIFGHESCGPLDPSQCTAQNLSQHMTCAVSTIFSELRSQGALSQAEMSSKRIKHQYCAERTVFNCLKKCYILYSMI